MNITKVTVKKIEGQQTLRGVASVVLDDEIKIRDIKILERGENGLSIMMPNKRFRKASMSGMLIRSRKRLVWNCRKLFWKSIMRQMRTDL